MKILLYIVIVLAVLTAVAWLGLQIKPRPFPSYPEQTPVLQTVNLPDDLPAPVDLYFRQLYGDEVPVITSAVLTGKATIKPFGFALPARIRFVYEAGVGAL